MRANENHTKDVRLARFGAGDLDAQDHSRHVRLNRTFKTNNPEGTNLMYEDDFLESDYEDRYTIQGDIDNEDRADYQDYLDAMDEQPESDEEDESFEIVGIFFYNPYTDVLTRADGSVVEDESDSPDIQYFSDGTPIPDEPTYFPAYLSN